MSTTLTLCGNACNITRLHLPEGSDTCITAYCLYDNGRSVCFITNDICEHLESSGIPTRPDLKTMHGQSCISSTDVKDLVLTDINGQKPIELPRTYTRDEIPVNAQPAMLISMYIDIYIQMITSFNYCLEIEY